MLLDGALGLSAPRLDMNRHALGVLSRPAGASLRMPEIGQAILRETLDSLACDRQPATPAGLTAVSPRCMWIWWDRALIDLPDDIISGIDKPRSVLRFYDITGLPPGSNSWNSVFDVDASFAESGLTVDFWAADRAYIVDLGLVYPDGRFLRLVRTNPAALPRENPGAPGNGVTRVELEPNVWPSSLIPDAEAKAWFDLGADWPDRDRDAELALRMLYRAFLAEGPRALKHLGTLKMADRAERDREYRYRSYRKIQRTSAAKRQQAARERRPEVMVALLDARAPQSPRALAGLPVPARRSLWSDALGTGRYEFYRDLLAASRSGRDLFLKAKPAASLAADTVQSEPAAPAAPKVDTPLVRPLPDELREPFAWKASSLFQTAKKIERALVEMPVTAPEPAAESSALALGSSPDVGGSEGRRLAGTGIVLTRMSVTLEGNARPGARFKVGCRVVQADAAGRFRVECAISGRKTRIPLHGQTASGKTARSVIAVEWKKAEKRPVKKAVFQ